MDGSRSIDLGVQGTNQCESGAANYHESDFPCDNTQPGGREQASHSVGLIYVYPDGPQLKDTHPDFNPKWVHNRSPKLSGLEVRDTFKERMGWTDRETVALAGGGHTLGRTHGNCNLVGTKWASNPYNIEG